MKPECAAEVAFGPCGDTASDTAAPYDGSLAPCATSCSAYVEWDSDDPIVRGARSVPATDDWRGYVSDDGRVIEVAVAI